MKRTLFTRFGLIMTALIGSVGLVAVPVSALARVGGPTSTVGTTTTTTNTAANQAKLQLIITRGNSEINRRLTTLNTLSGKISSASHLSSSDQSSLTSEVNTEIANLTALKTKLDADTDVTTAKTDAQSIITDYRVYALIVPKVYLVKTADDQQVAEAKLTALAGKLQTRVTAEQTAGKTVTNLQTALTDMNSKIVAAQGISSNIESTVINLQPSNYNSDHTVLSGDRDQLKTAQTDLSGAVSDAKTIVSDLKNL